MGAIVARIILFIPALTGLTTIQPSLTLIVPSIERCMLIRVLLRANLGINGALYSF